MLKGPQKVEHLQGLGILEVSPHSSLSHAQMHANGMGSTPIMDTSINKTPKGLPKSKGPRRPRSVVWYYFEKIPNEHQRAKCKLCGATCHHANNTSNLFKHLRVKHPSTYKEAETQREAEMDLYMELKAKFGKPIVRTGIRGRRPKALAESLSSLSGMADDVPVIPPPPSVAKGDMKPVGLHHSSSLKRSYGAEKVRQNINRSLLKMITVDLHPPSVVEGRGFREFLRTLDMRYEPPSKKIITKSMLSDYTEETKNKIKLEVVIASFFTLTVDTWVYRGTQNFLTLSAHFIKDNWEMCSIVLETVDRADEAAGDGLAPTLKRITDEWNITERIISVISDATDDTVSTATANAGWEHLVCFGHTLNLVVQNALKCVAELVRIQKKTSDAVAYFETCVKASDTLSAVQQQHSLPVHKLKQENPRFWNSTYKMLVRMVEQYEAVNTVLCFLSKDHMCLCDDEVELMRGVIEVLKPFQAATEEICSSGYTFMSKVIPIATLLQQVTASSLEPPLAGPQSALKTALVQQMQQHFSSLESSYSLAVSTLLDPRFKKHAFTDMAALEAAQSRLLGEITQTVGPVDLPSSTTDTFQAKDNNSSCNSFWNMFDRKVSEAGAMKNTASEAENESRRYFKEANIPRKADPLQWWRLNEVQFPHLRLLAQKYLCLPATATSSDRLFSKLGDLVESRRDQIKASHLNNVLFLNKNLAV